MARRRFATGDILEITTSSGRRGMTRVLRLDDFGLLIQVANLNGEFDSTDRTRIAYVNPSSVKSWRKAGVSEVDQVVLPTFFYGSSATAFTIEAPTGTSYIKGNGISADELVARGLVLKVLWLAEDIEKLVEDGTPPVWPWPL